MQVRVTPNPQFPLVRFVDNAGKANLYGLEFESQFSPTAQWQLYASIALLETEFDEFLFRGEDIAGDEFAQSPGFSSTVGAIWRHPAGWTASLDVIYEDEFFSNIPNENSDVVEDYVLLNGRFGYQADGWGAYVFAENLLDEEYLGGVFRGLDDPALWTANLGQPQTFGVILEANF